MKPCRPVVLSIFAIASALCTLVTSSVSLGAPNTPPPPAVDVVVIKEESITLKEQYSARVVAVDEAEVRPQVSGIIIDRQFVEGAQVEAGDQLYQIDPALYEATLSSAKAQLEIAQVNANNASRLATRYAELAKRSAVSKQQYEDSVASREQARAQILAAKASVKSAAINLAYTEIRAPISGVISRSNVNQGSLVSAQQAQPLATIRSLETVNVDIPVPVKAVLNLKDQSRVEASEVSLMLEDGTEYPIPGKILFLESEVDRGTGTVNLRTQFNNPQGVLLPGMFVRAEVSLGGEESAILAPQTGVTRNPTGGATAFIVNDANQVEVRTLVAGQAIGDRWLIKTGLKAGDRLIVSGLQKVRPGALVNPQVVEAAKVSE